MMMNDDDDDEDDEDLLSTNIYAHAATACPSLGLTSCVPFFMG